MAITTLVELYRTAFRDQPPAGRIPLQGGGRLARRFLGRRAAHVERFAAALSARGIAPGDRVAILSENRYEWAIADLAILAAGAVTVPIYPTLTAASARHILSTPRRSCVVVSTAAQLAKVRQVADELPGLKAAVLMDPARGEALGAVTWADLIAEGQAARAPTRRLRSDWGTRSRRTTRHHHLHLGHDRRAQGRDAHPRATSRRTCATRCSRS